MIVWIIYYFIGIYLTIISPLFLPEKYDRQSIMLSIHIMFTVPSAYKLAGNVLLKWEMAESLIPMLFVTALFVFVSPFLVRGGRDANCKNPRT